MFHVIAGLLALYVSSRLVWRQSWSRSVRWVLTALIVLVSQHHLVTRTFFGTMASPEVPAPIIMALGWGFGALALSAGLLVLLDAAGLLTWLFNRDAGRVMLRRPGPRAAIGMLALLLAAVSVWQAVRVPPVRGIEIELARLPAALDGYRVVQLTDLHASRLLQGPWMREVVARTNALNADLVLITGDLVDGTVAARTNDVAPLRDLRARQGVWAIPGNHEYYAEYENWLRHFDRLGLRTLLNQHVVIGEGEQSLVLAGTTDIAAARFGQPLPDIQAALAGKPADAPVILMSHRPAGAHAHARAGADLQLSGHTHGGQVLGLHWINQLANDGYVSGEYAVGDMRLYVSNGAGLWAGFPVRLGKPSEITEITLRSPAARTR